MNFDFTDDQQAIKRTAHDLLAQRFKPDTVRELAEGGRYEDSHWAELAERYPNAKVVLTRVHWVVAGARCRERAVR